MTPTTPENTARINQMLDDIANHAGYLWGRWQDEKAYEDFNDYIASMQKQMPEGFTITGGSKRPFGFKFTIGTEAEYLLTVTARSVGWKRVK